METIIVACSGGPDSMALLDQMVKKQQYKIIVCHVNYQKRESAYRDEKIVRDYCRKHQLIFRLLKPIYDHSDNFQAWARNVRYEFFEQVCLEFSCKDVFVAHQMDDHLETYIFQKKRNMLCDCFGLKDIVYKNEIIIHRPLLSYTKQELENYCHFHWVDYGIDESNLSNDYTRNQIRHSIIDSMSKSEKEKMCIQIEKDNQKLKERRQFAKDFLISFQVDELLQLEDNWFILDCFLFSTIHHHFSKKYLLDLCDKLKKDICIEIENYYLERYQNQLYIEKKQEKIYVELKELNYFVCKEFGLFSSGKTIEGMTVSSQDFPLVIRTVQEKDCIVLRYGTKNIHRFFVDRKIPKIQRKKWLVVENQKKEIIFVPQIGCDVKHFSVKSNLFMIQYIL